MRGSFVGNLTEKAFVLEKSLFAAETNWNERVKESQPV